MFAKRRMTEEEYVDLLDVSTTPRMTYRTRQQIIDRIYLANPVRWRRMQRDLKWLRRQMKKMGLNPDEARELL